MRPSTIVPIVKMPLTTAGKLDRRALESVTIQTTMMFEDAQLTRTQAEIREPWK
jgi:hypothetical protein